MTDIITFAATAGSAAAAAHEASRASQAWLAAQEGTPVEIVHVSTATSMHTTEAGLVYSYTLTLILHRLCPVVTPFPERRRAA
jgi:hypothetical protein